MRKFLGLSLLLILFGCGKEMSISEARAAKAACEAANTRVQFYNSLGGTNIKDVPAYSARCVDEHGMTYAPPINEEKEGKE